MSSPAGQPATRPLSRFARSTFDALEHIVAGLGTSILALLTLVALLMTAALSVVGIGLLLAPSVLRLVRVVADQERTRLSRRGTDVLSPAAVPSRLVDALRNPAVRRELVWVPIHAVTGFVIGIVGLTITLNTLRDGTFPLWWYLLPESEATSSLGFWTVHNVADALVVGLMGVGWVLVCALLLPWMAKLEALPGRRLLQPGSETDLATRVVQLAVSRAAALDAHTTELRRIERALHDGTQNKLVAVNVMLGIARRALTRDTATAEEAIDRAQNATEEALSELRAVVRSILPPVLTDRSLEDALTGLAANCGLPCRVDADLPGRYAASVESSVYFVVAEALTNVAKHSGAKQAIVVLRRHDDELRVDITDDGRGGATLDGGSGLDGIRRRVEAHDGTFSLASPAGGPTTLTVSLPCGL